MEGSRGQTVQTCGTPVRGLTFIQLTMGKTVDYSTIKRNQLLMHATTWTSLRTNMLSVRSKTKKGCMVHDPIYMKS